MKKTILILFLLIATMGYTQNDPFTKVLYDTVSATTTWTKLALNKGNKTIVIENPSANSVKIAFTRTSTPFNRDTSNFFPVPAGTTVRFTQNEQDSLFYWASATSSIYYWILYGYGEGYDIMKTPQSVSITGGVVVNGIDSVHIMTSNLERSLWDKNDTIISWTDSIYVDTLLSQYEYVEVIVQDTGTVYTDSLQVETLDMNYSVWTPVAVRCLCTFTDSQYMIPGAGNTRRFLVLDPNIYIIRIRLLNTQVVEGRRVFISIMAKNY